MKRLACANRPIRRSFSDVLNAAAGAGAVVLVFASLVFLALRILPGDPTTLILGDDSTASERLHLAQKLGFDRPLLAQYAHFIVGLVRLDLGTSLSHPDRTAFECVATALKNTALLAFIAVALGALGGVGAALLCVGPWLGRYVTTAHGLVLCVAAVPMLALAPLATWVCSVRFALVPLPGDPDRAWRGLLFAAVLLALPLAAQIARIGRATLVEQRQALYLHTALAKGASMFRVWVLHALPVAAIPIRWVLHALPVAAIPILIVLASQLGALLGGAVVLERFFEQPGLGTLMLEAYMARDIPVLEASIVAAGLLFIVVQVVATGIASVIDPRGIRGA